MTNSANKKTDNKQNNQDSDFGALLANARKAKNLTVEEVSDYLKIPVTIITVLEQSNIAELPPLTFSQGYIRAYARYLAIPEDNVLQMYKQAVPGERSAELRLRSKLPGETNSQSPLIKLITIILIVAGLSAIMYGGFNYYQKKSGVLESELGTKSPGFTGNSLNSPSSAGEQRLTIKKPRSFSESETLPIEKTDTEQDTGLTTATNQPSVPVNAEKALPPVETPEEAPASNDIIEIYAEKGAWLEVYDAEEQRLFYNMLKKGRKKILTGTAPFRLALGNADSTRITVNNVELDIKNFIRSNNTASFMVEVKDNKASLY